MSPLQWRILSEEEQAAMNARTLSPQEQARRAWDAKHPRCHECGQFLGSTPHFQRSYFGELVHV